MNEAIKWTDIVAAVVVIYSAVLSTIVFIQQIRGDKPRGLVKISPGSLMGYNVEFNLKVIIEFTNIGKCRIKIINMGIILPNGYTCILINPPYVQLPAFVEPGDSIMNWMEPSDIRRELNKIGYKGEAKIIAFAKDATGKIYKGNSVIFNL
ncbi:MAG: hypothetical protein PWR06_844 [Thermoanaerobacteraceae bacterium]|nr:hypothetical protein [Thermoanaerobacteraceae bacterium]